MTDDPQREAAAAAAEQEEMAASEAQADQEATAAAEQEAGAGDREMADDLAKAAVAFLEKANAVAAETRAEVDPLDAVDTSVAGLGAMDPVLDDAGLATIKARLADAAAITTAVNVARLLAMKLLALG